MLILLKLKNIYKNTFYILNNKNIDLIKNIEIQLNQNATKLIYSYVFTISFKFYIKFEKNIPINN